MSARRVVLIRPHMLIPKFSFTGLTVPPLGLAYVAAAVREAGHSVTLVDGVGEAVEQHRPHHGDYVLHGLTTEQILARIPDDTECVGVSCMFSHEFPVYRDLMAAISRRFPRAHLVAGGEHVTAVPDDTFAQCPGLHVVAFGESEETMLELLTGDFSDAALAATAGIAWRDRAGAVHTNPRRNRRRDIDGFAQPAWDLVPLEEYWKHGMGLGVNRGRSMPMLATRGCPYQCTFCSNPNMWTTRWIARKPAAVLAEMRQYVEKYGAANFDFYDLTAIVDRRWIVDFCRQVIASGLTFTYQLPSGTRSEAIDQEVAELLFASGCRNMTYAPESGSPETLVRIKKKIKIGKMLASMRACRRGGLNIKANIIVGFPGDTHMDLLKTFGFILRMAVAGVHDVTVQPFSAYPGSELYDQLRRDGRIVGLDDEFYFRLSDYSDLSQSVSWSEHFGATTTNSFRTLSMLAFYVVSFSLRPWRLWRIVQNIRHNRQESRLERALYDLFERRKALAPGYAQATPAAVTSAAQRPPYI